MKIRKSSRITALFLALIMILPLISIPTFAAEETEPTPIWGEDFQDESVGDYIAATTDSGASAKIKQNGTNKYWEIPVFAYDESGNPKAWDACSGGHDSASNYKACKCGNINKNMLVANPELAYGTYDEVILSAKYFIDKGSKTHITLQIRNFNATHVKDTETPLTGSGYLNLYRLDYEGGNYAFLENSNITDRKYYNQVVDVNKWVTISVAINLDNGAMKIYVDGNLATSATLTYSTTINKVSVSGTLKNITIPASKWTVYKTTENRTVMNSIKGVVYVDDIAIYNGREGLGLSDNVVYEQDFEGATKATNVLVSPCPSTAQIVDAADTNHGQVLQINCAAVTDGKYYAVKKDAPNNVTSSYLEITPAATDGVVTNDGVTTVTGTVTISDTERDITGVSNDDYFPGSNKDVTPTVATVTNETDTYYIVSGALKDSYVGNVNVGKPAFVKVSAQTASKLTLSADYYFSTDVNRPMDIRLYSGTSAYDYLATSVSEGKVSFNVHSGAQVLSKNNKNSASLGTWVNLKVVINFTTDIIECYLNGNLFAVIYEKDFAEKEASLTADKWSLGHFTRGKNAKYYKGYCQVDNLCVEIGTATNVPFGDSTEDFTDATNETVAKNFLDWGLSTPKGYTTVETDANNNKYWSFDVDYSDTTSAYSNSTKGKNVDFNAILRNNEKWYSYLTSDEIVLEAKYFLAEGTTGSYLSQLRYGSAYTTKHAEFSNGLDMYKIVSDGEGATVAWHRSGALTETYADAVPVGEWFTLSMVLDLDTGVASVYVNGILAIEGKMSDGTNNLTNLSFAPNSWIVAKAVTSSNAKGTISIDDLSIKHLDSSKIVDETGKGLVSAKVNGKLIKDSTKFYGTVTEQKYVNDTTYAGLLSTLDKASIRLTATENASGLRFVSKVNTTLMDQLYALQEAGDVKSVTIGTLIAPTDYVNDEFTMAALDQASKTYLEVVATQKIYLDHEVAGLETPESGFAYLAGSIVNINDYNLARAFSGRAYVEVELHNGETVVLYSEDTKSISVQDQAKKTVFADGTGAADTKTDYYNSLDATYKAILDQYVAAAYAN